MAPWVAAGLLSPFLGIAILGFVALATAGLYLVARRAVSRLGPRRLAAGYLGTITVAAMLTLLAHLLGSFGLTESLAVLAFFVYASCVVLAVVIVPIVCVLGVWGRASAPRTIIASVLVGVVLAVAAYALQGSVVPEERRARLLVDMLYLVPFFAIVSAAFSVGARLPWTIWTRAG